MHKSALISIGRIGFSIGLAVTLALGLITLIAGAAVGPAERYVSTTGTDSGGCTNSASPCQSINYAIGESSSGDQIH